MPDTLAIPAPFLPAYHAVQRLADQPRYEAALIFGSLARGEAIEHSDVDVKVVVSDATACAALNHPIIGGKKLDMSFNTLDQLRSSTQAEIERGERQAIVAESIIVFDKTGALTQLRAESQRQPPPFDRSRTQFFQFMFYHANDKAERFLQSDPAAALLVMHVTLNDLLHMHYQMQARWWVSSKRLRADLHAWDAPLALLVDQFVHTCEVQAKFNVWSQMIDHMLAPLGGRQPIGENNCACAECAADRAALEP